MTYLKDESLSDVSIVDLARGVQQAIATLEGARWSEAMIGRGTRILMAPGRHWHTCSELDAERRLASFGVELLVTVSSREPMESAATIDLKRTGMPAGVRFEMQCERPQRVLYELLQNLGKEEKWSKLVASRLEKAAVFEFDGCLTDVLDHTCARLVNCRAAGEHHEDGLATPSTMAVEWFELPHDVSTDACRGMCAVLYDGGNRRTCNLAVLKAQTTGPRRTQVELWRYSPLWWEGTWEPVDEGFGGLWGTMLTESWARVIADWSARQGQRRKGGAPRLEDRPDWPAKAQIAERWLAAWQTGRTTQEAAAQLEGYDVETLRNWARRARPTR